MDAPSLPQSLARGVAAMGDQRWDDAIAALAPVFESEALKEADDLRDVRASVCSLYAQALLESGQPHQADAPCRQAIRALRQLNNREGLDAVRALQDRIVAAIAHDAERAQRLAEQKRIAATPLEALLAGTTEDAEIAEVLVKKAQAHADVGERVRGAELARRAITHADAAQHVTWQVFAHMALARADAHAASEALATAYRHAERANEFNLVSAVARTARELQVDLPTEPGPHGLQER